MPMEFWGILGILVYIEACILCAKWFQSASFDHYPVEQDDDSDHWER